MPEDAAPQSEETPETTDEAASQETPAESPAESVDYQKRYDDLRPEFDRTTQRLKEFEEFYGQLADPETQAQALKALGLELQQDEEDDDEYRDPDDELRQQVQELTAHQQQEAEVRQEAETAQLEQMYVEQEIGKLGNLSEAWKKQIAEFAVAYEDDEGLPDVKGVYDQLVALAKEDRENYVKSKKSETVQAGTAGIESIDMNDEDARRKVVADLVQGEMDAEQEV